MGVPREDAGVVSIQSWAPAGGGLHIADAPCKHAGDDPQRDLLDACDPSVHALLHRQDPARASPLGRM